MLPTMRKYLALLLLTAATTLAGCAANRPNPVASADRPEIVALAMYGSFVIAEEAAADIAEDPTTPQDVKNALAAVATAAAPIVAQARPIVAEIELIRSQLAEAEDPDSAKELQGKLLIASQNVNDWITRAAPLLQNLVSAVQQARKP